MLIFLLAILADHFSIQHFSIGYYGKSVMFDFKDMVCPSVRISYIYCVSAKTQSNRCLINPRDNPSMKLQDFKRAIRHKRLRRRRTKYTFKKKDLTYFLKINILGRVGLNAPGFYYFYYEHFTKDNHKHKLVFRIRCFKKDGMFIFNRPFIFKLY